ncbi:MAG: bis-aminopropyl spermidine synthase family protein [Gemmatimonadota bacterium]|nr:bis-aminopropyl spermidine synthase family protein [Gemmatimonadota bacterium]
MSRRTRKRNRSNIRHSGNVLADVAADARLDEGPEGVRRVLRAIYRAGATPVRDLSRETGLPVPVVAAVRGELETRGWLERRGGVILSSSGRDAVEEQLGLSCRRRFQRPVFPVLDDEMRPLHARMEALGQRRPAVDVRLDQSHATAETALRRAIFLYEHDGLEGRDVLILGDDDLTSLAIGLLADFLGISVRRVVVLECDPRLVAFLSAASRETGQAVEAVEHDLRADLPGNLLGGFDLFFTDPPYTLPGLSLFVSRGAAGLRPEVGKQGVICFGSRRPDETATAVGTITDTGLAPVEIVPDFNRYAGAQMLAGVSHLIRTVATARLSPRVNGFYEGSLYTADRSRKKG